MSPSFRVQFEPDGRSYEASGPVELFLAAASCGIVVEQPCGSRGTCGKCRVKILAGDIPPGEADRRVLGDADLGDGWRLACSLVVDRALTIEVPPAARSLAGKSFGADLPPDAGRLPVVAAAAFGEEPLGLAIDIGSTSLAAALIDPRDGRVITSGSRLNPQVAYGADVISRINYSVEQPDGLARLTAAVRDGIRDLVCDLLSGVHRDGADVVVAAVAGNPTMMQTWAGVDVASLGTAPYLAQWSGESMRRASDVGLPIRPEASVYAFPMVRSHVGSDACAAAVACDLDLAGRRTLLIDLGTNTEVCLAAGGRFVVTSAAAGPAFEGATITDGCRAAPGAIDAVIIAPDGRLIYKTVGGGPARGICGSGLIDAVAELLRVGVISPSGCLRRPGSDSEPLSDDLSARLTSIAGQQACVLARSADTAHGRDVVLTARDVRELQLVKGSIRAAATIVCRHLGFEPEDLQEVLLAGAFGNYVRKSSAMAIGLVPSIEPEQIRFVGNAAGLGARLAVCDRRIRDRARELASRAEYVELAGHPGYQALFLEALAFPDAAVRDLFCVTSRKAGQ